MPVSPSKPKGLPSQTVLSSYFSQPPTSPARHASVGQRSSSPIDLTAASDDERPTKRRKVLGEHEPRASLRRPERDSSTAAMDQYRLGGTQARPSVNVDNTASEDRREKAKGILLSGHDFFDRNAQPQQDPEAEDDSGVEEEQPQRTASSSSSAAKTVTGDDKFKETMAFFAKSKPGKKGRKVAAPVAKKVEEIGPSGKPYTPLELQVNEFGVCCVGGANQY